MNAARIERLFTRPGGGFGFARWGRPLAPVIFGAGDESLGLIKGAIEAVAALAGLPIEERDPELGANLMLFFLRDWRELGEVPNLGAMLPDLEALIERLEAVEARQYRAFRFDEAGAIRACFAFVRLHGDARDPPADAVALTQAVGAMLAWGSDAFAAESPLLRDAASGAALLRPEIAGLIAAAYDPRLPAASEGPELALRLAARVQAHAQPAQPAQPAGAAGAAGAAEASGGEGA